jgi:hypothetical protein
LRLLHLQRLPDGRSNGLSRGSCGGYGHDRYLCDVTTNAQRLHPEADAGQVHMATTCALLHIPESVCRSFGADARMGARARLLVAEHLQGSRDLI